MGFVSLFFTFYCITISVASFYIVAAIDTLTPYQRLKDGQTLVSSNQRFEVGFFAPHDQTNIRYLGVWYKDITPLTVVWVANRTKPVKNLDATLIVDLNGGLAIQDCTHNLVLLSMPSKNACQPVLQILNSGNLVVRDNCNGYLWESFDYPSDTLLPGMKIGWDYKTDRNRVMTSWKNCGDPQSGDFSFGLDTPRLPQLVLERNSIRESRWGPWDGERFSGTNALWTNPIFQPVFLTNSDGVHFTYNALNKSVLVRLVVTQFGKVQFLTWKNYSEEWLPIVTLNKDSCDAYGSCGPYGFCYIGDLDCHCLRGFTVDLSGGWMDWTAGCKRNFELECVRDGFVEFKGLKLPDNGTVWENLGHSECEKNCLQECSCTAYTYLDVYANGTSACVVWLNELLDMQSFPHGGDDLHIRMARAELELIASAKLEKDQNLVSIIISSTAAVMVVLGYLIYRCIFTVRQGPENCKLNSSERSNVSQQEYQEFRLYNICIISAATNNFSNDNKIGQGGFGPVYKGEFRDGKEIAVKRLSRNSRQGHEQFENESSLIARLQHRNLIKLYGCCVHEEERMLIYEYLLNKSLDKFIFDEARKQLLSWAKRFDIILEVAKGLVYLHDDSGLRIVHRDLKASNILLDGEMNAKISDFGLAKILGEENQPQEETMRVHGTHGYMSPEYTMHGQFSTKSDVFSFGVLVLEILSGRKNWGFHHPDHDLNLLGHVWNMWKEGKALEILDSALEFEDSLSETQMLRCIVVGLLCVQNDSEFRPVMSTVICMLANESIVLPEPKEPGFYQQTGSVGIRPASVNELTCTTLSAR